MCLWAWNSWRVRVSTRIHQACFLAKNGQLPRPKSDQTERLEDNQRARSSSSRESKSRKGALSGDEAERMRRLQPLLPLVQLSLRSTDFFQAVEMRRQHRVKTRTDQIFLTGALRHLVLMAPNGGLVHFGIFWIFLMLFALRCKQPLHAGPKRRVGTLGCGGLTDVL